MNRGNCGSAIVACSHFSYFIYFIQLFPTSKLLTNSYFIPPFRILFSKRKRKGFYFALFSFFLFSLLSLLKAIRSLYLFPQHLSLFILQIVWQFLCLININKLLPYTRVSICKLLSWPWQAHKYQIHGLGQFRRKTLSSGEFGWGGTFIKR